MRLLVLLFAGMQPLQEKTKKQAKQSVVWQSEKVHVFFAVQSPHAQHLAALHGQTLRCTCLSCIALTCPALTYPELVVS